MALTKELVELHHGTISATSAWGKGATLTVHLPLGKSHLAEDEITKEVIITDYSSDEMTTMPGAGDHIEIISGSHQILHELPQVLLVEDNPDMRQFICGILGSQYEIDEAMNGLEGWEKAVETIPDLILSDVMMPKMDGFELCNKLKTDLRTSHIPVILLTARVEKDSKLKGLKIGADDYLAKPFDSDELLVLLQNRIQQRKNLRERFSREVTLQPKDIAITSADEQFLQTALDVVEEHISDSDFNVQVFREKMCMSRMQLQRKLKALTDQSPGEFIRILRLKRAAQLLSCRQDNITQITYQVGFNNLSYFAKCFKEHFGLSPSDYASEHNT